MEAVKLSGAARMLAEAWASVAPYLPDGAPAQPNSAQPSAAAKPTTLPVLDWLPFLPALATEDTRPLLDQLVEAAPSLSWCQTYAAGELSPAFLTRYGWTELLGPYGLFASEQLRLGFLLLGPDTLYPPHAHASEEVYLVLAGTAAWQRDSGPWRDRPPGTAIHHPPHLAHATRTASEPLLALYLWWGADPRVPARMVPPTQDRLNGRPTNDHRRLTTAPEPPARAR